MLTRDFGWMRSRTTWPNGASVTSNVTRPSPTSNSRYVEGSTADSSARAVRGSAQATATSAAINDARRISPARRGVAMPMGMTPSGRKTGSPSRGGPSADLSVLFVGSSGTEIEDSGSFRPVAKPPGLAPSESPHRPSEAPSFTGTIPAERRGATGPSSPTEADETGVGFGPAGEPAGLPSFDGSLRSEEHTSELQSL